MDKKKNKQQKVPKAKLFSFKYILYDLVKWFGFWQTMIWYRIKKIYDGPEAKKRIKHIINAFDDLIVCFSGGKDSL